RASEQALPRQTLPEPIILLGRVMFERRAPTGNPMIRAIYFDAVGTLIHPQPSVAEVYAKVGLWHGSCHGLSECLLRFRRAFQKQESLDQAHGWMTSEKREYARWQNIVGEVLDDVR